MTVFSSHKRFLFDETTIDISNDYLSSEPKNEVFLIKDMSPISGTIYAMNTNGKLKFEMSFDNGFANGIYRAWSYNENPMWEFNYQNGYKHGEFKMWHDNGQLEEHGWYRNGKRDGATQSWHKTGKPFIETSYKKGLLHGQEKVFFQNGHEWKVNLHDSGECIDSKHYKFHNLHECWGQSTSHQMKLSYRDYYAETYLESEVLKFYIITGAGMDTFKEGGLCGLNKMKGVTGLKPALKLTKKWHKNGLLKSEEIYEWIYGGRCMFRRIWDENGKIINFDYPHKEGELYLLKDVRNYFDNKRVKYEEIRCYIKYLDTIFYIEFLNSWFENGRLKFVKISDSHDINWIDKRWAENGAEIEMTINNE